MTDAEALLNQGKELVKQGRNSEAEQAFRSAIEIQPDYAEELDTFYELKRDL